MVSFKAEIERFGELGEKTGWYYIYIPRALSNQIKANCKKSFRVQGTLDTVTIEGLALSPMGEGDFILALKKSLRQALRKEEGAVIQVNLQEDIDFKIEVPDDLELCLSEEPQWLQNFLKLPKSHQNWYINWLNSAKTEPTRTKRLANIVSAMDREFSFGEMIREGKSK